MQIFINFQSQWFNQRPMVAALLNGIVSGLSAVTPAAGYINGISSLVLGIIAGAASYMTPRWVVKQWWGIDDALNVSSTNGLSAIIGTIFVYDRL